MINYFKKQQQQKNHNLWKTGEKSNNSDIKSVTVTHPKTASKLSTPIKYLKTITQQPETVET